MSAGARTELAKAVVILVLGLGMLIAPDIGEAGAEDLWTIPRLAVWAWNRPLGLVLTAVGLVGVYALVIAGRRPPATTTQ